MTLIATDEGWLCLAMIIDLFSRRVVGWSVSDADDTELASQALKRALLQYLSPLELELRHQAADRAAKFECPLRRGKIRGRLVPVRGCGGATVVRAGFCSRARGHLDAGRKR